MKRAVCMLLLAGMFFALPGCTAGGGNLDARRKSDSARSNVDFDQSLDAVKQKGRIVLGMNDSFAPMGFHDKNGEIIGFEVDVARAAAEIMGVEVSFSSVTGVNEIDALKNGEIDLICGGFSVTDEREEQVLFTGPYLRSRQIIVVARESEIDDRGALVGKMIGVRAGGASQKALVQSGEIYALIGEEHIEYFEDSVSLLEKLSAGKVDAAVMDEAVFRYHAAGSSGEKFRVLAEDFGTAQYAVAARRADKALVTELDFALKRLQDNGMIDRLAKKWLLIDQPQ